MMDFLDAIIVRWYVGLSIFGIVFNRHSTRTRTLIPYVTLCVTYTPLFISSLQHLKSLGNIFCQFHTEFQEYTLLFKTLHISTCKKKSQKSVETSSLYCMYLMTDMKWSSKRETKTRSPSHTIIVMSLPCWLNGVLVKKLSFFLDTLSYTIPSMDKKRVRSLIFNQSGTQKKFFSVKLCFFWLLCCPW